MGKIFMSPFHRCQEEKPSSRYTINEEAVGTTVEQRSAQILAIELPKTLVSFRTLHG